MTCKGLLSDVTIRATDHLFLSSRPASSPSAADDALQTSVEATIFTPFLACYVTSSSAASVSNGVRNP